MMFPRDVSFSLTGRAGHVRAVDCCRRTLGLGLDACTRARGPRSPALALDSLGEHLQRTAKHHLRSTGADTRLSSNHGSNERSPLRRNFQPRRWHTAGLAITRLLLQKPAKRGRGGTQPAKSRRRRTTRARLAREAITARWRELPRVSPLAGGTSRPGQRLEAGRRSARTAARHSSSPGAAAELAVQHTHQQSRHEHRSLTLFTTGPRGLPQVHLERREARQAPGADPTVLEGHREIPADDAEARLRRRV